MALGTKKPTLRARLDAWAAAHGKLACVIIALVVAAALFGLFLFVTFSDFGGTADFIYSQF